LHCSIKVLFNTFLICIHICFLYVGNNTNFITFIFCVLGGVSSSLYLTPNGTKLWKPDVPAEFTPALNVVFYSWDDVVSMYDAYAEKSGFSTRLGTHKKRQGVTTHRFIMCNRAGKPTMKNLDSTNISLLSSSKSSSFRVSDCKACIRTKFYPESSTYVLYSFVEAHNHELIGPEFADLTKKRRKMGYAEKEFVHCLSLNNIGPNVAHKLQCSLKGGHHNVHGTKNDFKNFSRDIRLFIGDRDAQLTVDMISARTQHLRNFFFEYLVVGHELRALFWADDVSRCSYETFGDVLAFDATYKTNK
jgi:hypothetical protein